MGSLMDEIQQDKMAVAIRDMVSEMPDVISADIMEGQNPPVIGATLADDCTMFVTVQVLR